MAGPLTTQAQQEAVVRYGPQRFALRELLAQIVTSRDMALHAAAGAERGIQAAIHAARGETKSNYASAISAGSGTTDLVKAALDKLGPGATPYAAAFTREGGLGVGRMVQSQTNALQDLTNRRLEAASGRAFATQHATDVFNTDVGKVQRSYQELAGEQGAFTQGRVGELKKQAADRAFTRDLAAFNQGQQNKRAAMQQTTTVRGQNLSHADRQATLNQQKAAAKNKQRTTANRPRSGVGSLTQGEENKVKDFVGSVLSVITNPPAFEDPPKNAPPGTQGPKLTHQRMLQHLRNGTNPLGKPIPDDVIRVAYDLKQNGGFLSPQGIALLHARGMHIPPEWLPKKRNETFGPTGAILPGR